MGGAEILTVAPEGAAEGDLIDQNVWGAIRTLWEKGGSKKAIARELDLDNQDGAQVAEAQLGSAEEAARSPVRRLRRVSERASSWR